MSQSNSQIGVPTSSYPYRQPQHLAYSAPQEIIYQNRRPAHQVHQQQLHHGPLPSSSPGVPSPSASPGARHTPPHDMSKQRHTGQLNPQAGVMLPQPPYRMQAPAGQMHHGGVPHPGYAIPGQRPGGSLPPNAASITQGAGGPRMIQPGAANAPFAIPNHNQFVTGTMMPPQMYQQRAAAPFHNPQAAHFPPYYYQASPPLSQNPAFFQANQMPQQANYPPAPVVMSQPPQPQPGRNERKRNIIRIQDPTSGEDLTDSIMRESSTAVSTGTVNSQGVGAGATGTPPQSSDSDQASRRIQAEFLTMVSQVASEERGEPPSQPPSQPPAPVTEPPKVIIAQRGAPPPVPAEPSQPPAAAPVAPTAAPAPVAPPGNVAAAPPTKAVAPPTEAVPQPPKAATPPAKAVPPPATVKVTEPPVVPAPAAVPVHAAPPPAKVPTPDAQPKVEKQEPPPPQQPQQVTVPASKPPAPDNNNKKKKKKMQDLEKKELKDDMYDAFRSTEAPSAVTPSTQEKTSSTPEETPPTQKAGVTPVPKKQGSAPEEVVSAQLEKADIPPPVNIVREPVRPVVKPAVKQVETEKNQVESGAPGKANYVAEKDSSSVDPVATPVVSLPKSDGKQPPAIRESQVDKVPSPQASKEQAEKDSQKPGAAKAPEPVRAATPPSMPGVAKPQQATTPAGNPGVGKPQQASKGPEPRKEQSAGAANKGPSAPKGQQQSSKGPQSGKSQQAAKEPQAAKAPPATKEPEFKVPAPAPAPKEAKTNNVGAPGSKAVGKASEETKGKEKAAAGGAKTSVDGDNTKNKEGEPKPSDNKSGLKYTYREDQWSPLNQGGKKQYDRSFLLQFQPDCTSKPQGLPDIPDIVLEKADIRPSDGKGVTAKGGGDLFMPTYMKSPRMNQSAPNFPMGGGGGKSRQSKEKMIISRPSSSQDEQLKRSKNAWKPDKEKKDKPEEPDAELLKRFKSILNKLTPQNFSKLMSQTMALPINTEERLKGVIDLVFEKAIMEPGFSQAYANMCRVMQNIEVKNAQGVPVQFRKLIIIRCQKQFEKQRNEEELEKERQRIAALPTDKERAEATEEMEYLQMIAKKQIVGNIRFIGELFKLQLLTEKIMQGCIFLLLKAKDEESLECMSKLVTTIGQSLDHPKGKALMDQYFHQVDKIIKEKKVSSRIRFMLQDLKDLRSNNWVPRRNEAKPMTIDQIRKEAEKEKQRKEQEKLVAQFSRPKGPARSMEKYQSDVDGWNTVPTGRATKQNVIENPSKLKITRQNIDDSVQLGPGGRPGSFGGWGKGSSGGGGSGGGGGKSSSEKVSQGNRYQMLEEKRSMIPPRDMKGRSSSASKRSMEREIDRSRQPADRFAGSQRSRSNEIERKQEKRPEPTPSISEGEYEKRARATIEEYLNLKDFKEAIACIEEMKSPNHQHILVRLAIEDVLEKSSAQREAVGRLFHRLLNTSTIDIQQFNNGLGEILEFADDMAIDIPMYWTYLGEIIGGMAAEGATQFAFLRDTILKIEGGNAGKFLAEIMKAGVKFSSENQMIKIWKSSKFAWSQFVSPGEDVQEFIARNKVEFTERAPSAEKPATERPLTRQSTPKEETRIGNFQRDLILLFQRENLENNAVFDFVESTIPPLTRNTKEFIRALVSAVCFGAVKGEGTNSRGDHELLKKRSVLMQKYIDGNPQLELQALFAVQALNYSLENPPGLLRLYFDVLYDEDVISEDTFYAWRDSTEPTEKTGKGIALKSVTSFYTWLEESDPPN